MTKQPPTVVLVVDDEEPIRRIARRILEGASYQVLDTGSGHEAIAILSNGTPVDLLIADLEMPELAGEEMARRIRQLHPDLRVLYVTGHIDRLLDERHMLWEGEAYLDKPFSPVGLLQAVSMLLKGTLGSA